MLADSPGSRHSSRLHMNPRNLTLIFISMHPAHEHTLNTCKWIRGVCHPLCLRFPAQFCHLSPDQCMRARVYAHARTHIQTSAFNLCFGGVFSPRSHLPTMFTAAVDRGHSCISGQPDRIQKDIRATLPPYFV